MGRGLEMGLSALGWTYGCVQDIMYVPVAQGALGLIPLSFDHFAPFYPIIFIR